MTAVLQRPFYKTPGVYVLLRALAPRKLFNAVQICLLCTAVHARVVAGRICAQHGIRHVRGAYELFEVEHREKPQCAEESFQPLCVFTCVGSVAHLAAHTGHALYNCRAQKRRDKAQLGPAQHRNGLKALQKEPEALLSHLAAAGEQHGAAKSRGQNAVCAAAQMTRLLELRHAGTVFALYHVPVVQQPFARGRRGRHAAVAPRDLFVTAAYIAEAVLKAFCLRKSRGLAFGRQKSCLLRGIVKKLPG